MFVPGWTGRIFETWLLRCHTAQRRANVSLNLFSVCSVGASFKNEKEEDYIPDYSRGNRPI